MRDSGRSPILVGCERVLENWAIKNLEALTVIRGLSALLTRFEGRSPGVIAIVRILICRNIIAL